MSDRSWTGNPAKTRLGRLTMGRLIFPRTDDFWEIAITDEASGACISAMVSPHDFAMALGGRGNVPATIEVQGIDLSMPRLLATEKGDAQDEKDG